MYCLIIRESATVLVTFGMVIISPDSSFSFIGNVLCLKFVVTGSQSRLYYGCGHHWFFLDHRPQHAWQQAWSTCHLLSRHGIISLSTSFEERFANIGTIVFFLRPHPGALRQLMCPHPGEFAHFLKKTANARESARRGEGDGSRWNWLIDWRINVCDVEVYFFIAKALL